MVHLMLDRAGMVDRIFPAFQTREEKGKLVRADTLDTELFKQWMGLHLTELDLDYRRRPYLEDGEHALRAILATRLTTNWDLRNCPDDVLRYLRDQGLLEVRNTRFDLLRKDAGAMQLDAAMRYRSKGETETLLLERNAA